jgi:hypothetical protein
MDENNIRRKLPVLKLLKQTTLGKTGASLVFILGVMTLFLAIAASALVAASSTVGADVDKLVMDNLELAADSLHRTIKTALEDEGDDSLGKHMLGLFSGGEITRTLDISADSNSTLNGVLTDDYDCKVTVTVEPYPNGEATVTVTVGIDDTRRRRSIRIQAVYNLHENWDWRVVSYEKIDRINTA